MLWSLIDTHTLLQQDIGLLFAAHYLADLVASLLQLAYAPISDAPLQELQLGAVLTADDRSHYAAELTAALERHTTEYSSLE